MPEEAPIVLLCWVSYVGYNMQWWLRLLYCVVEIRCLYCAGEACGGYIVPRRLTLHVNDAETKAMSLLQLVFRIKRFRSEYKHLYYLAAVNFSCNSKPLHVYDCGFVILSLD